MATRRLDGRYRWVLPPELQARAEEVLKRLNTDPVRPKSTLAATLAVLLGLGLDAAEKGVTDRPARRRAKKRARAIRPRAAR